MNDKTFEDDPIRDIANIALWGLEWRMPDAQEDRARLARIFEARIKSDIDKVLLWEIIGRFEAVDLSLAVWIVRAGLQKSIIDATSNDYLNFSERIKPVFDITMWLQERKGKEDGD